MHRRLGALMGAVILAAVALIPMTVSAATPGGGTRVIPSGGTTRIRATATGTGSLQQPELREGRAEEGGAAVETNRQRPEFKKGIFSRKLAEGRGHGLPQASCHKILQVRVEEVPVLQGRGGVYISEIAHGHPAVLLDHHIGLGEL